MSEHDHINEDGRPGDGRKRSELSRMSLIIVDRVAEIIQDLKDYWPLTLRQVYYQLVAAGDIANNINQYSKLSRILTQARLQGLIDWDAIEDRTRSTLLNSGFSDKSRFIDAHLNYFLSDYRRDLMQSQKTRIEIWVEKDALSSIMNKVAEPYCIPVIVARGFSSISYVHECRKRIVKNAEQGKKTLILYFGDLDPSGWEMLPAMMQTLNNDMGLAGLVDGERYALTLDQVREYNLPRNPEALKEKDTRAKKFKAEFGDQAYELDALPPAILEDVVRVAIRENLDLSQFEAQRETERAELVEIEKIKSAVSRFAREKLI